MLSRDSFRALLSRPEARSPRSADAGDVERLSRGNVGTVDHPAMFGGGYPRAQIGLRTPTRAYGYPAVVEEFETVGSDVPAGVRWCTLAVSLPNVVPTLIIDHRVAHGQPYVIGGAFTKETGDIEFDLDYVASADQPEVLHDLLTVEVRTALLQRPVQRMAFTGSRLMLRSFDGIEASREVIRLMAGLAAEILVGTPGYRSPIHPDQGMAFPRGVHGA